MTHKGSKVYGTQSRREKDESYAHKDNNSESVSVPVDKECEGITKKLDKVMRILHDLKILENDIIGTGASTRAATFREFFKTPILQGFLYRIEEKRVLLKSEIAKYEKMKKELCERLESSDTSPKNKKREKDPISEDSKQVMNNMDIKEKSTKELEKDINDIYKELCYNVNPLNKAVKDLEEKIKKQGEEYKALCEKTKESKNLAEFDSEKYIERNQRICKDLRMVIQLSEERIKQNKEINEDLERKIYAAEEELKEIKKNVTFYRSEEKKYEMLYIQETNKYKDIIKKNMMVSKECARAEKLETEYKSNVDQYKKELSELKEQVSKVKEEYDKGNKELEKLKNEIKKGTEESQAIIKLNESLYNHIDELEEEYQKKNASIEEAIEKSKNELKKLEDSAVKEDEKLKDLEGRAKSLDDLPKKITENKELKDENDILIKKVEENKEKLKKTQDDYDERKKDVEAFTTKVENSKETLNQIRKEYKKLKKEMEEKSEELEKLKKEHETCLKGIEEAKGHIVEKYIEYKEKATKEQLKREKDLAEYRFLLAKEQLPSHKIKT